MFFKVTKRIHRFCSSKGIFQHFIVSFISLFYYLPDIIPCKWLCCFQGKKNISPRLRLLSGRYLDFLNTGSKANRSIRPPQSPIKGSLCQLKFRPERDSNPYVFICFSVVQIYDLSYIHLHCLHPTGIFTNSQCNQLPDGLIAQLVRAMHRYRRGHGFQSCWGQNFFLRL